jgi:hypothetical protein
MADTSIQARFLDLIRGGTTVESAAEEIGTTRQTVHRYIAACPEFSLEVEAARAVAREAREAVKRATEIERLARRAAAGESAPPRGTRPKPRPDPMTVRVALGPGPSPSTRGTQDTANPKPPSPPRESTKSTRPPPQAERRLPPPPVDGIPVDLPYDLEGSDELDEVKAILRGFVQDDEAHPLIRNTALNWLAKITVGVEYFERCKRAELDARRKLLEAEVHAQQAGLSSTPLLIYGIPRNGSEAPGRGPAARVVDEEAAE